MRGPGWVEPLAQGHVVPFSPSLPSPRHLQFSLQVPPLLSPSLFSSLPFFCLSSLQYQCLGSTCAPVLVPGHCSREFKCISPHGACSLEGSPDIQEAETSIEVFVYLKFTEVLRCIDLNVFHQNLSGKLIPYSILCDL